MSEAIAILGGTGKEGRGLAARWARAGREVLIGSRDADRATSAAAEVAALAGGSVAGSDNAGAAAAAGIVVLATPYSGLEQTITPLRAELEGKLVVSAVIPLQVAEGRFSVLDVPAGSAAALVAAALPGSRVGAAFHNVSAKVLIDLEHALDEDIPVAADDEADRATIIELCADLGARGVPVGGLALARYLEGFTAVLLSVNKLHRSQAGIRFTNLPEGV
ncbi:MAG: 8-hydroxy-5-deazaflavin:NADPH oxidoreductase [Chloroflexota bacterium]|nr:8-hydroxy-5-deazaflavin:NADPH oxidoreductase [Chloroflexota bacterium]